MKVYEFLAVATLAFHFLWILWVIFGVLLTRRRRLLRALHLASLVYSILIEILPWPPCPLTVLEQWLEDRAGITAYRGPFLVHYLDALVYPHVPVGLLVGCAVAVCVFNLAVYGVRYARRNGGAW
jgi:hypothetical protein